MLEILVLTCHRTYHRLDSAIITKLNLEVLFYDRPVQISVLQSLSLWNFVPNMAGMDVEVNMDMDININMDVGSSTYPT